MEKQLKAHMDDPQFTKKPLSIDPFTDLPRDRPTIRL
jgi:hypothetical protein